MTLLQPMRVVAKSPVKWVGSKKQLEGPIIKHILSVYPDGFDDYYEPFVGSGAIFFALRSRGLIHGRAFLSDMNVELIEMYMQIREDVNGVLKELKKLCLSTPDRDGVNYYQIRSSAPKTPNARAARTIYLNKNGYNGLYRVNKSGGFNVPWNRRKTVYVPEEDEIRSASMALQGVGLSVGDFSNAGYAAQSARKRGQRVFVYYDPPYIPASASADFTAYQAEGFDLENHKRLAGAAQRIAMTGVPFLISNSDTPTSRKLYRGLTVKKVSALRNVNSDATKRSAVSELLVSNKKEK